MTFHLENSGLVVEDYARRSANLSLNMSSGYILQGQQQTQQPEHMMARVSTVVHGEIDYEEMPDLVYDTSEETLESEVFK